MASTTSTGGASYRQGSAATRGVEAAVFALCAAALAAAVYGENAVHGGFLLDAWLIRAEYAIASRDGVLSAYQYFLEYPALVGRPLQAILFATLNLLFGSHMGFWIAATVGLGVAMSASLFLLLRELDLERVHAGLVAALVLIFPAATSLRLWTAAAAAQLTVVLATLGFLAALRGFEARGRRRLALHGTSVGLFAASLLLYESVLPLMLASVLLYRLRVPWRTAARRWALDCAVLVPLALAITRSSSVTRTSRDAASMWQHAESMIGEAKTLLATIVVPFGADRWPLLAALALIPATAVVVAVRLPPGSRLRLELRRWLAVSAAGLVVVVLGYAIFVPAHDYYAPLAPGLGDRVNAVPSVGWVLLLYGTIMLAATLALRGLPRARRLAAAVTVLACLAVAASWLHTVRRDVDTYVRAYAESQRTLDAMATTVPDPVPGSAIWAFAQPLEVAADVPVFAYDWEITSAVRLLYDDPTLVSHIAYAGTGFDCGRDAIVPSYNPASAGAYGRTYFVDAASGRGQRIDTPAQCRRTASSLPRAPGPPPDPGALAPQ